MLENSKINNFFQSSSSTNDTQSHSNYSNYMKSKCKKKLVNPDLNPINSNKFCSPEKNNLNSINYNDNENKIFKSDIKDNERNKKKNISRSIISESNDYNFNKDKTNKNILGNSFTIVTCRSRSRHRGNNSCKNFNNDNENFENCKILDNEEKVKHQFDDDIDDDKHENFHLNKDDINEKKNNTNLKGLSPPKKMKKNLYNSQNYLLNNNIVEDNNLNGNKNINSYFNKNSSLDNNAKNRALSQKTKKKRKIVATNLKYSQNIGQDKDEIVTFENALGANDCFLNSIIQVLFHLDEFKKKLLQMNIEKNPKNPIYQLHSIFHNYEIFSKVNTFDTLSAGLLRESLHYRFGTYNKGKCGDPMETISEILEFIHSLYFHESNNSSINNFCRNELCPSHSNFLLNLKEIKFCPKCKAINTQIFNKDCFMYDVLSYEILSLIKDKSFNDYKYSIFSILKHLNKSFGDNKQKLEDCKCEKITTKKCLVLYERFSPYLIINITWDTNFPKMSDICKIYGLIPSLDSNKNLFEFDFENDKKKEKDLVTNYYLYSMILYGQNHYTCFFYNKVVDKWSFVDDESKKNFNTYNELIHFLIIRRSIPVGIIFYYRNYFKLEDSEKILLNEKEFNDLYQKCLENDKRDIEEKNKMKQKPKINNGSNKSNQKQNDIKTKLFNNKKNNVENRCINNNNIENRDKYYNVSFINNDLGNEQIVKIRRNKQK